MLLLEGMIESDIILIFICSVIGIGEIVLLPLDALKIKMQISSSVYKGKSALDIVRNFQFVIYNI